MTFLRRAYMPILVALYEEDAKARLEKRRLFARRGERHDAYGYHLSRQSIITPNAQDLYKKTLTHFSIFYNADISPH